MSVFLFPRLIGSQGLGFILRDYDYYYFLEWKNLCWLLNLDQTLFRVFILFLRFQIVLDFQITFLLIYSLDI